MYSTVLDNKSTAGTQMTASAAGNVFDMTNYSTGALLIIDVNTLAGGNQTLDAKLQVSGDNTAWTDLSMVVANDTKFTPTFTQMSAAGQKSLMISGCLGKYIRVYYTLAGDEGVYARFKMYLIVDDSISLLATQYTTMNTYLAALVRAVQ